MKKLILLALSLLLTLTATIAMAEGDYIYIIDENKWNGAEAGLLLSAEGDDKKLRIDVVLKHNGNYFVVRLEEPVRKPNERITFFQVIRHKKRGGAIVATLEQCIPDAKLMSIAATSILNIADYYIEK